MVSKTGLIKLPKENTPVQGYFNNLHEYWEAPDCVLEFWATGCKVNYVNEKQYQEIYEVVVSSYTNCIKQFYIDNAL